MQGLIHLYTTIGYPCTTLCAKTEEGLDGLRADLKDKITLLSGHSGVGKSTIINKLIPGVSLRTGDISEYHNKGMHTTTFSEMVALPEGGYLIDTPGIKGFRIISLKYSRSLPDASLIIVRTVMNQVVRYYRLSRNIILANRAIKVI